MRQAIPRFIVLCMSNAVVLDRFVYFFKCMTNLVFGLLRSHALGIKSECCHKVCLPLSFVFGVCCD